MKLPFKIGSVLLAVLMLATSLTAGFAAAAADRKYDELVLALKDGKTTLDPNYEYYVKELSHYTVINEGEAWSDEGNTLSYLHAVEAKDNGDGKIALAAKWFYNIVDDLQSTVYGEGCYNTSLIASEIKTQLYAIASGADHMVRTDSSGKRLYVAPATVAVSAGMESPVEIDEYSSKVISDYVYPENTSNQTVFWRVLSGSDYVAVDQSGRIYGKRPTPEGYMAVLQCVAVDSLDVVAPAVYNEDGEIVTAPVISFDDAVYTTFYATVNDVSFSEEELLGMLSVYEPGAAANGYTYEQMDALYRDYILPTFPDYGKTNAVVLTELAAKVPANLEPEDAATIRTLLDRDNLSDAEFSTLASFCYSAVQEEVLSSQNLDIATINLANLSDCGLDSSVVSSVKSTIRSCAEKVYDSCGYTDEYDFFHMDTLVNYFLGGANVINAANWYHSFKFTVATDLETAMMDIFEKNGDITKTGANHSITMSTNTYSWSHRKEFDASGTKPRYVLADGYAHSSSKYTESRAFAEISAVNIAFDLLHSNLPANLDTLNSSDAKAYAEAYRLDATMYALQQRNYSSELLSLAFGKKYYWITSIYNQCRPNYAYHQAQDNNMTYPELYAYRDNVRSNPDGSSVPYEMTIDKVNTIVSTIDSMLLDENIASIISSFINFNDAKYLGTAVYGATFDTLQEMLELLINSMLYTGDIPTMLLQKVYPMLTKLVEETIMGAIKDYEGAIDLVNDSADDNVTVTLIRAFNSAGVYLYPYEYAEGWTQAMINTYPEVYAVLHQSRLCPPERKNNVDTPKGWDYTGTRENVGWDQITEEEWEIIRRGWNVSNRIQFEDALAVSLNSLMPVLATALGGSSLDLNVVGISLGLKPIYFYEFLILPLAKALGVSDSALKTKDQYYADCASNDKLLALKDITTPLLDWVEQDVLGHPVQSIADLLVNVTSLLAYKGPAGNYSGFVEEAISRTRGIELRLTIAIDYSISVFDGPGLYNMIAGLLPDGADLSSLNGILKMVTGMVKAFQTPIVVGTDEFGQPTYQRSLYDADGNFLSTTTTSDKALADTAAISLPPIQEGKLKECGTVISHYESPLVPTNDSGNRVYDNVFYQNIQPGQLLLYLFRYIFYGIMNTDYSEDNTWTNPCLLDAFLPETTRNRNLLGSLSLGSLDVSAIDLSINGIINNIVFNPEDALCALIELFAPNEQNGFDLAGNVYKIAYPDYQQEILLAKDANGKQLHETFGAKVNYTKYWTRDNAKDTVNNLEEIVANVLSMLGMGSLDDLLSGLINDKLYTNSILSMLANLIYTSLQKLQSSIDLQTILDAAFDIRIDVNTLYNTLVYNMCLKYGFTEISDMPMVLRKMLGTISSAGLSGAEWDKSLFYEEAIVVDENGDPVMETVFVTDDDGNKIQELDENGNPAVDDEGNPVYKTEEVQKTAEKPFDWGLGESEDGCLVGRTAENSIVTLTKEQVFFDALNALLSPLTTLFQRILLGKNLSVFTSPAYPDGLLTIPMYQIYYYALIPLFEALGMPSIVSFADIVADTTDTRAISTAHTAFAPTYGSSFGTTYGDVAFFEDLTTPIRALIAKVLKDPIATVLDLIPNLLFYISVGALNDTLNSVLHFAYVLLDILSPIVDVVPILNKVLGSIEILNINLNLSLPLCLDFNTIINQLIGSFTEGTLISGPLQGAEGIEITDGLFIKLPALDLSMLCAGQITPYRSASENTIVRIGTGDGADLVTVILQFVMDTLFMYENTANISLWAAYKGGMDGFDTETVYSTLTSLNVMANEKEMPDKAMYIIYLLLKYIAPISGELADRLLLMPNGTDADGNPVYGMTIQQFFASLQAGENPLDQIKALLTAKPSDNPTIVPALSFLQRIVLFFQRILAAIRALFSGSKA